MDYLEKVSEGHKGLYVDLFVRPSNEIAIQMYRNLGYDVYQTVDKYYSGGTKNKDGTVGEHAYDMRKSLSLDPTGELSKPTGKLISPQELEFH